MVDNESSNDLDCSRVELLRKKDTYIQMIQFNRSLQFKTAENGGVPDSTG